MRIAIAGATGVVGRHVVDAARERGHEAVVLARSAGVDAETGAGLAAALAGADAVVDVLNVTTLKEAPAVAFFEATTRRLLQAERAAGVGHHVLLSIVGIDRAPFGYYAGKLAQERLVEAGAVPWTILRATQFHEFARQMLTRAKAGPLQLAPRMRTQTVAARTVGERLVELVEAGPSGRAPDLAGPREEDLAALVRAVARAEGRRGPIPAIAMPGAFGRAMRDGSLLPGPDADLAGPTFAEWLAAR